MKLALWLLCKYINNKDLLLLLLLLLCSKYWLHEMAETKIVTA